MSNTGTISAESMAAIQTMAGGSPKEIFSNVLSNEPAEEPKPVDRRALAREQLSREMSDDARIRSESSIAKSNCFNEGSQVTGHAQEAERKILGSVELQKQLKANIAGKSETEQELLSRVGSLRGASIGYTGALSALELLIQTPIEQRTSLTGLHFNKATLDLLGFATSEEVLEKDDTALKRGVANLKRAQEYTERSYNKAGDGLYITRQEIATHKVDLSIQKAVEEAFTSLRADATAQINTISDAIRTASEREKNFDDALVAVEQQKTRILKQYGPEVIGGLEPIAQLLKSLEMDIAKVDSQSVPDNLEEEARALEAMLRVLTTDENGQETDVAVDAEEIADIKAQIHALRAQAVNIRETSASAATTAQDILAGLGFDVSTLQGLNADELLTALDEYANALDTKDEAKKALVESNEALYQISTQVALFNAEVEKIKDETKRKTAELEKEKEAELQKVEDEKKRQLLDDELQRTLSSKAYTALQRERDDLDAERKQLLASKTALELQIEQLEEAQAQAQAQAQKRLFGGRRLFGK